MNDQSEHFLFQDPQFGYIIYSRQLYARQANPDNPAHL